MKRKYNSGVTIVEIIISIAIISVVLVLLFSLLLQIRNEDNSNNIQSNFIINQASFIRTVEEDIVNYGVKSIGTCSLSDVNISTSVASGDEDNYLCLRLEYAADYIKDKVAFLLVYNYYTKYEYINGNYQGYEPRWVIEYVRGSYGTCYSGQSPKKATWQNAVIQLKEMPDKVEMNATPYVRYTAMNAANTLNAAEVVFPLRNAEGEIYDIILSFTFKGNNLFKCDNRYPNKLKCVCESGSALCSPTYNYSDRCS